jgi:hybrid cluster-associated redox disulfide protein
MTEENKMSKINKEQTIGEIVRNQPEVIPTLQSMGMHCLGCPSAQSESLEAAAMVHGLNIENVISELNGDN